MQFGVSLRRQRGQTIVVAMIILGLLLILGFVFIGIIKRNILTAGRLQTRSAAGDLMEAGIRYAHGQLLNSELGADWRGGLTPPSPVSSTLPGINLTLDPDALYLRRPEVENAEVAFPIAPGSNVIDKGGPDGLGPFVRVNFNNGRALVRVRYAPSDINIFSPTPTGALRNPGLLRNYIIIESVGRPGRFSATDPTNLVSTNPVKFRGYASAAELYEELGKMRANERHFAQRAITRAFASTGIIESALYVTNKYNVTRPAELGVSKMLGAIYKGKDVATGKDLSGGGSDSTPLWMTLGTAQPLYTVTNPPALTANSYPGGGSVYINADVVVHGNLQLSMNRALGDKFISAGVVAPADNASGLRLFATDLSGGAWTTTLTPPPASPPNSSEIDSRGGFSTHLGLILDGLSDLDGDGWPRGAPRKMPPSMEAKNPDSGESRYLILTKQSGAQNGGVNLGEYGYGQGVYVNNLSDRQTPETETGRQAIGESVSQVYDWLNPNNGQNGTGWRGFYYVPPGAYVQLLSDGFVIIRNNAGAAAERTWKRQNGTDSGQSLIRYRIGLGSDSRLHIVNTLTPSVTINGNLGAGDFDKGPLFNGVLYFEGNVRVRGTIPTDVQMTIVSNATIYVEGSITKGVLGNGLQTGVPQGERLQRLSHSMLMLMAKDYVTLNTTQFVGPAASQSLEPVSDVPNTPGYNPVRVRTGEQLTLQNEFVLDNEADPNNPALNPLNPSTWRAYPADYYEFNSPTSKLITNFLMAHTMDDGPAPATFFSMNVNFGAFDTASPPESTYYFPVSQNNLMYTAYTPQPPPATYQIYGLGGESFQRFGKFESTTFPLLDPNTANLSDARMMISNNANGVYRMFSEGTNDFLIRQTNYNSIPTNDYLVGKTALIPHDIRIEASMFAEEGSFFVIPGQWINPNPNDRREIYGGNPVKRMEDTGSMPGMPFYGEPADIRISIIGSVSENMPPSIDVQSEWMRKWGWIPKDIGDTGKIIPDQHVPHDENSPSPVYRSSSSTWDWVPNLTISYDPVLATARRAGFNNDPNQSPLIRTDAYGRALPPLPRLPVSPALAYFGEVR